MSSRGRDKTGGNTEPMPFVRKFGAAAQAEVSATAANGGGSTDSTKLAESSFAPADLPTSLSVDNHSRSRSPRRERTKRKRSRSGDRRRSGSRRRSRSRRRSGSRDRRRSGSRRRRRSRSGSRDRRRSGSRDRHRSRSKSHSKSKSRSRSRSRDRRSRHRRDRTASPPSAPVEPVVPKESSSQAKIPASAPGVLPLLVRPDIAETLASSADNSPHSENGEDNAKPEKRARKSRWSTTKSFVPGMPTILPSNLSDDQRQAYLLQLEVEDATRKLRLGDFLGNPDPAQRSPSPEPIYDASGKRLNTREVRKRQELEQLRHEKIQALLKLNPNFKPPADYRPPTVRLHDKVWIPQENHPEINFVGLLIGPRGNTLKSLEAETGAKIIIRGKGSVKEGKLGHREGPMPGENEPLHAYVTATDSASIKKACDKITSIINEALMIPDGQNELRKLQLRELALLNGTLRPENLVSGARCSNCGSDEHKTWECPDAPNVTANIVCTACGAAGHIAKDCKNPRPGALGASMIDGSMDDEYSALMVELGEKAPANTSQQNGKGQGIATNNSGTSGSYKPHSYNLPSGAPIMRVDLTKPQVNQNMPGAGGYFSGAQPYGPYSSPGKPTAASPYVPSQPSFFNRPQGSPMSRPHMFGSPSGGWGPRSWGGVPPPSNRYPMPVRPPPPSAVTGLGFMPPPPPPPAPVPKPDLSSLLAPAPPPPPPQ